MSNNYEIIYLFGYNPKATKYLERLIPIITGHLNKEKKVALVLIHDGVLGVISNNLIPDNLNNKLTLYAVSLDLKARGIPLERISDKFKLIDYEGLVDVLDSSERIVSWI